MNQEIYNDLSLFAEYDFSLGGAQRMLSIISKRINKPIYVFKKNNPSSKIWDSDTIEGIPPTKIVFSLVVDKCSFQELKGKKQIKFCHSGNSLTNFISNENAKKVPWLTHRERAYEHYYDLGFNINLIEKGYIPYDLKLQETKEKKDFAVFISRICEDKKPEWAMEVANKTNFPLYIAGSWEFKDYVVQQKNKTIKNVTFVEPEGMGVSFDKRNNLLKKAKVLIHCSDGRLRDYLEYSILDGLAYGCIPLCITPDKKQFEIIEKEQIGKISSNPLQAQKDLFEILNNYEFYVKNSKEFMRKFLDNQNELWKRWESTLEKVIEENF